VGRIRSGRREEGEVGEVEERRGESEDGARAVRRVEMGECRRVK